MPVPVHDVFTCIEQRRSALLAWADGCGDSATLDDVLNKVVSAALQVASTLSPAPS